MPSLSRRDIVTANEVSTYHCIARCVRRAFLCGVDNYTGKNFEHRKGWVKQKLKNLSEVFAIDIGSYAVMSNHLHLTLRIRPDLVNSWNNEEIIERWWRLFPRKINGEVSQHVPEAVKAELLQDEAWLTERRTRLSSLSWFMRCLCEYIARRANKEDNVTGRFWEGRFKSQALLDDKAVLAANIYVDLNPIRAGVAHSIENSGHVSIVERIRSLKWRSNKKHSYSTFLAELKSCYHPDKEVSPFLPIEEKDYIAACRWVAKDLTGQANLKVSHKHFSRLLKSNFLEKLDLKTLNAIFSKSSWAIGSLQSLRDIAEKKKVAWIRGMAISGSIFV